MANLTTGSMTALNETVVATPLDNFGTAGIIISGTWTGTISFEGSLDGVTYVPVLVQELGQNNLTIDATANGQFLVSTSGLVAIRCIMSLFTSGTADIVVQANAATFLQRSLSTLSGDSDGTLTGNLEDTLNTNISGLDTLAAKRRAQVVVRTDGIKALAVDSRTVVESTFGFDQNPDSYFVIRETGGAGTTWEVKVAATANDPTTPDRDIPAYSKTFTVLAGEVGDEIALRDRMIQELNVDTPFKDAELKAVKATDRAIINIRSEAFSLSGEFFERPNPGDFDVVIAGAPGDGVVVLGFDNLISRSKPVSISRDFDSPHRLGLFGITGEVRVTAKELSDLFVEPATLDGLGVVTDMSVNGAGTPQEFIIPASLTTDLFIEELRIFGQGNGIQFKNWLSNNQPLNNGLTIEIQSDNIITTLPTLKTTADIKNKFSFGQGATGFALDIASGRDDVIGVFTFANPFIIRVAGTFTTDDHIKITINDNMTSTQSELEFWAKGFEKEP